MRTCAGLLISAVISLGLTGCNSDPAQLIQKEIGIAVTYAGSVAQADPCVRQQLASLLSDYEKLTPEAQQAAQIKIRSRLDRVLMGGSIVTLQSYGDYGILTGNDFNCDGMTGCFLMDQKQKIVADHRQSQGSPAGESLMDFDGRTLELLPEMETDTTEVTYYETDHMDVFEKIQTDADLDAGLADETVLLDFRNSGNGRHCGPALSLDKILQSF